MSTCEFCDKFTVAPPCDKWRIARSCPNFEVWILARARRLQQSDERHANVPKTAAGLAVWAGWPMVRGRG